MAKLRDKQQRFVDGYLIDLIVSDDASIKKDATRIISESFRVNHFCSGYVIEIINPVEYASYVEHGHRTANHKGWGKGQFMMTIPEQELESIAPKILENKIMKYFGGMK